MASRQERAALAAETLRFLKEGSFVLPETGVIQLTTLVEPAVRGTKLHSCEQHAVGNVENCAVDGAVAANLSPMEGDAGGRVSMKIEVTMETTLAAAARLVAEAASRELEGQSPLPDREVCLLNCAIGKGPGGGFLGGSDAQEESLARSSALYLSLETQIADFYEPHRSSTRDGLYSNRAIYSPSVPFFRDDAGTLQVPWLAAVVTCPAVNAGVAREKKIPSAKILDELLQRIRLALNVAKAHGHRWLVLSAFGCGGFKNSAKDVAACFGKCLRSVEFSGFFERVVFAVPDKHVHSFETEFNCIAPPSGKERAFRAPPRCTVVAPRSKEASTEGTEPAPRKPQAPVHNALFEQCYRGAVVPDGEWQDFMAALHRDLPVTFRFIAAHPLAAALAAYMSREFVGDGALNLHIGAGVEDESVVEDEMLKGQPLTPISGLEGAWRLDLPKAVLRRHPGPKRLHGFMKRCVELGVISRQEAVSMVPAAVLGSRRGHCVLDACASPGMKTLQLLDAATAIGGSIDASEAAKAILQAGAVVANELDGRRACMLAHHVNRIRHPAGLVIHHNATALPPLGLFDRVLCDVPCSGDGTIRKAPQLLKSWRPNLSSGLHRLQLRIACAGASVLRIGGHLVYSTCSLSPIENEAVVASLLQRAAGALELIDCDEQLPDLQRRPGLESWSVHAGARHCKSVAHLQSPEQAAERGLNIPVSAWPPMGKDTEQLGLPSKLRHCWRFFPHHGDGGGFFVALLKRNSNPLPQDFIPALQAEQSAEAPEHEDLPEDVLCKEALPASQSQTETAFCAVSAVERARELVEAALDFYGIDSLPVSNFFVRNEGEGRNVYLVSDAVRDILLASPDLRALVGGIRVFDENRFLKSSSCKLRLVQEGVRWLAPLMSRRRCPASGSEMLLLLEGQRVLFSDLATSSPLRLALESVTSQGSVAIVCEELPNGACICVAAERGAECVSLFVNQYELKELRECLSEFLLLAEPAA